jgi:ADP-ribose pyrophosphatase
MKADYLGLVLQRPEFFANPALNEGISIITDPDRIHEEERRLNTEIGIIYRDKYVVLVKDLVIFPGGKIGTYIRILPAAGKGGVVILPFYRNQVVLLRHFRHSTRKSYIELPRGFSEPELSEERNAEKEILEETGYKIKQLRYLGNITPDTGLLATQASVYLAVLDNHQKTANIDKNEAIQGIEFYTLQEIKSMIANGKIEDGYTLGALALYLARDD